MRITKIEYLNNNSWLTIINLWICDTNHTDTCYYMITSSKPTQRRIRKFKKEAKTYFRHGTRKEQRERNKT